MVYNRGQHMFVTGDAEKLCSQWYFGGQVKCVARRLTDGLLQLTRRPTGGIDDVPAEQRVLGWQDPLLRHSRCRLKQRAQTLVAGHHIGQRRAQRVDIQIPADPKSRRHVVNR
ncbi:Uncharacterised protein [Mycobacteroides abscessus subsp. massiliense]|nr:Uncharacterised protein [Mycobacteroides abscessus subsp. massiliense]